MKTIKFIPVIILTTMMLGFTACNDNDDDNDNVSPVGSKITKMEFSWENIPYLAANINYSDSKVTGCDVYSPYFPLLQANISISYQGNKIIVSSNGEDDEEGWFDGNYTFTYTLENGRAISCITETPYKKETNNISYEYNNDGYLSKVIVKENGSGGHSHKSELNFIYYENDLIKMEYSDDEYYLDKVISTVTNSTIENKSNFPSALLVIAAEMGVPSGDLIFNSLYMSYLGIFGKTPKHYQSSMTYTVSEFYGKEGVAFDYSIDKNGNINSIILTGIGYEEGPSKVKFSY